MCSSDLLPIFAGGTMLYFKALREGLDDLPRADAALRAEIEADAAARGWPALHAELARVDAATAARLAPADAQRIGRALEIQRLTGVPMSALIGHHASPASVLPFELQTIALEPADRVVLHARIARRFDAMLAAGLVTEVHALRLQYPALTAQTSAMRCVGYRQAWAVLDGILPLEQLRDRGIFATRQLAKRQLTWMRGMRDVTRVDCLRADIELTVIETAMRFVEEKTR